ncbi:hypothetical protein [Okeania sp. SIO1I7]|nr:hypothetical protein [Okeania sp. SIO1I7]
MATVAKSASGFLHSSSNRIYTPDIFFADRTFWCLTYVDDEP